jgi:hypothetical protein
LEEYLYCVVIKEVWGRVKNVNLKEWDRNVFPRKKGRKRSEKRETEVCRVTVKVGDEEVLKGPLR